MEADIINVGNCRFISYTYVTPPALSRGLGIVVKRESCTSSYFLIAIMQGWGKIQASFSGLQLGEGANKIAKGFNSSVQATRYAPNDLCFMCLLGPIY
jgi:hypothetical protein